MELVLMIGEAAALVSALCWAISSIVYREAIRDSDPIPANLIRSVSAAIVLLVMVVFMGKISETSKMDTTTLLFLVVSTAIGLGLGDTLYFKSLSQVGVTITVTVSSIYPLFVIPWAILVLQESVSTTNIIGATAIVLGVVLVSRGDHVAEGGKETTTTHSGRGLILPIASALAWSVGASLLKLAAKDADPWIVNVVRMMILSAFLLPIGALNGSLGRVRAYTRRTITLLIGGGIVAIVVGGTLFLTSLKLAGAVKAVPISSTYPIFSTIMAVFMFKEKVTMKILLGVAAVVTGTILLAW